MTEDNSSGATFAPAADTSAPAASAETSPASFGGTRGSGLARGKRSSSAAAPASKTPVSADYKPTTIEVVTPKSEYQNPFASPEPVSAPAEAPVNIEPAAPVAPAAFVPAPLAEAPAAEAPVAPVAHPVEAPPAPVVEAVEEKREINILPPAEAIRPATSWENTPAREERPTFRPERRGEPTPESAPAQGDTAPAPRHEGSRREHREPRAPRDPNFQRSREGREGGRDGRDGRERRDDRPRPEHRPEPVATPAPVKKGFFGWLKSLFSDDPTPAVTPATREDGRERTGEGHPHRRRRHRGGRGHGPRHQGDDQGGPHSSVRSEGGGHGSEREHRGGDHRGGDHQGEHRGGRRRRHRGGGRGRGDYPRSEGQQGGGAI